MLFDDTFYQITKYSGKCDGIQRYSTGFIVFGNILVYRCFTKKGNGNHIGDSKF